MRVGKPKAVTTTTTTTNRLGQTKIMEHSANTGKCLTLEAESVTRSDSQFKCIMPEESVY